MAPQPTLETVLQEDRTAILSAWLRILSERSLKRTDLVFEKESEEQSRKLLEALTQAVPSVGDLHASSDAHVELPQNVRDVLEDIAEVRTERGVSTVEMGQFIGALKEAFQEVLLARADEGDGETLRTFRAMGRLVDHVVLSAIDLLVQKREATIERQREEMNEVAAPVVRIWDNIVTIPLIGTLDSFRAQTVMENLLEAIVHWEARIAIIDITGVSTVDTLVAQHLLKTASAVRLMGSECVICGISPKIAQTVVNLGVDLPNITTRGDLQSGLAYAFKRVGATVERV